MRSMSVLAGRTLQQAITGSPVSVDTSHQSLCLQPCAGEQYRERESQQHPGWLCGLAALASVPGVARCCCASWICMWVIGPGGATIYPWRGGWVTMGAQSSFSFIWACRPPDVSLNTTCSDCLIYHWPQIWKCRSPHWGPVMLLRVQSGDIMREALHQS